MKQLANDASRATAAKEAARVKKDSAKAELKKRVSAMLSTDQAGVPKVSISGPQVIKPNQAPAAPSQPNKPAQKTKTKTKSGNSADADNRGFIEWRKKKMADYQRRGMNANEPTREQYNTYKKYGE